jgi:hypothetical protein
VGALLRRELTWGLKLVLCNHLWASLQTAAPSMLTMPPGIRKAKAAQCSWTRTGNGPVNRLLLASGVDTVRRGAMVCKGIMALRGATLRRGILSTARKGQQGMTCKAMVVAGATEGGDFSEAPGPTVADGASTQARAARAANDGRSAGA